MDISARKLLEQLEPMILDLDSQKKVLEEKQSELENVSRMLAYTKDNLDMVSIYADQDLIINNLSRVNSNREEYRASCYLLSSENENVKRLPQYEKAYNLINDIIEYFKLYKAELIVETQELTVKCADKEMAKKYYNILSSNNPYIEDVKEFNQFLNKYELETNDQINILIGVLKNNYQEYIKKSS